MVPPWKQLNNLAVRHDFELGWNNPTKYLYITDLHKGMNLLHHLCISAKGLHFGTCPSEKTPANEFKHCGFWQPAVATASSARRRRRWQNPHRNSSSNLRLLSVKFEELPESKVMMQLRLGWGKQESYLSWSESGLKTHQQCLHCSSIERAVSSYLTRWLGRLP